MTSCMLISTLHSINWQRINRVHYTRDNIHNRLMQIHLCCISKSPFYHCVTMTPMSRQSLQKWMVHMWLCQPRPWTHTMQERRRKVSIQLPGPLAPLHSAELIMHLQYISYLSFLWKLDMPLRDYPTSWAALWLKVLCPLYRNVSHMSISTCSFEGEHNKTQPVPTP